MKVAIYKSLGFKVNKRKHDEQDERSEEQRYEQYESPEGGFKMWVMSTSGLKSV